MSTLQTLLKKNPWPSLRFHHHLSGVEDTAELSLFLSCHLLPFPPTNPPTPSPPSPRVLPTRVEPVSPSACNHGIGPQLSRQAANDIILHHGCVCTCVCRDIQIMCHSDQRCHFLTQQFQALSQF